jgi:hypothetical protein
MGQVMPRVCPSMAGKSIAKVTSVLLASLLMSTCGGSLRDHQPVSSPGSSPASSEEKDIRAVLLAYEEAWNRHKESALAPLLDEEFVIWLWIDGERKLVATKGSYVFWLRDLFIKYRYLTFGIPEIRVKGDRATVYVPMTVDARVVRGTFRLIQRSGKWLIQEFEF